MTPPVTQRPEQPWTIDFDTEKEFIEAIKKYLHELESYADHLEQRGKALEKGFNLVSHLERQKEFSEKTFGPGQRTKGVIDHIRKELLEIEADPKDITEWVDVIILAFDGAWRAGWNASDIVASIVAKQEKNESRTWPDWRKADPNKAIEHDRTKDALAQLPQAPGAGVCICDGVAKGVWIINSGMGPYWNPCPACQGNWKAKT